MNSYLRPLLFGLSILLATSCTQPTVSDEKKPRPRAEAPAASIGLCDSFSIAQFAMDTTKAALLADAFLELYRHDDAAGHFTADASSISIPNDLMLEFERLSPDLDPATQCLGVRIAYGLDEEAQPLFLFAPIPMTRTPSAAGTMDFQLAEPTAWYSPANNNWQRVTTDAADAATARYAKRTLKYIDGALKPLRIDSSLGSASDPSSTFFPFTEFRALIRENQAILQDAFKDRNGIPSITAVRLRWAAEKTGDDGTLKQIVVMVPVLDGPDYPGPDLPLTLKAADLNSLCPKYCADGIVSYRERTMQ